MYANGSRLFFCAVRSGLNKVRAAIRLCRFVNIFAIPFGKPRITLLKKLRSFQGILRNFAFLRSPAHGRLRASLRRGQDLRRLDIRTPSGNPAADLINGGRIRKQLADVSKLFHVSECALRIFLPSDGAFDDKITETFHYNAAGERGRRGVFCDEIAAVAIQGHIFYGIPAYSRAGSRTTRSRYNRFSFARQAVSFSNVRFFLRILAYKRRFSAKPSSANCPQLPILKGIEAQLKSVKFSSNFLGKIKFLRQRLKISFALW